MENSIISAIEATKLIGKDDAKRDVGFALALHSKSTDMAPDIF